MLHREEIVASRDAGTALMDHARRRRVAQYVRKLLLEYIGWLEAAVRLQIKAKKAVLRSGYVPADRIEGLVFSAESIGTARVDHGDMVIAQVRCYESRIHAQLRTGSQRIRRSLH